MKVTLINAPDNPIEKIAQYASICYNSDPKNPQALVDHLYRNGHHSVFEHLTFAWKIEGISRACSHQLVRHRQASYTQRSQRYCTEYLNMPVVPPSIAGNPEAFNEYRKAIQGVKNTYAKLIDMYDIPREDARYILPNAMGTELYFSCNFRELMHICNERLCTKAQWEIRMMVQLMKEQIDPALQKYLVPKCQAGFHCPKPCDRG